MSLIMEQFISVSGKRGVGKEKGNRYGVMGAFMKGIGRIILPMDKED